MKEQLFILRDIMSLLQHLAKHNDVYQIAKDSQGEKGWQKNVSAGVAPLFGQNHLPLVSPKGLFFAENEPIYQFSGETFTPIKPELLPRVIFGAQACDLTAISYLDTFFKDDPYYQARRQLTLLVGIDCTGPCDNGFCPEVNAGPQVAKTHADLVLSQFPHDENTDHTYQGEQESPWLLLVVSKKGSLSLKGLDLDPAPDDWLELRSRFRQHVVSKFGHFDYINNGTQVINEGLVPPELWEELSVRCLACSGCTNLCPTCSCYSTYEQHDAELDTHTTHRIWDSCQFEGFQREASNHNPSQLAAQRTERFWFHKFSDDYLPEFGRYGCVGCGRCEQTCTGSIGVHTVMKRIDQVCCN